MNDIISGNYVTLILLILLGAGSAAAQVASGGSYTLTQTATANGGVSGNDASVGGNYSVEGTIGQSAAGTRQQSGNYNFQPGFWTVQAFAPSSAGVSVSGRVLTAGGKGIRNVRVAMTNGSGETRSVITGSFGYFLFEDVASGGSYFFTVSAKRFTFSQATLIRSILDETDDLVFTANGDN